MASEESHKLKVAGKEINYVVRVSKRAKHLRLVVSRNKGLEVVTPKRIPMKYIVNLITANSEWIIEKLDHIESTSHYRKMQSIQEGSSLLFLGQQYLLMNDSRLEPKEVVITTTQIKMNLAVISRYSQSQDDIRTFLKQWYVKQAKEVFKDRVEHYSKRIGVSYNRISIKNQKTRWGSCSSLKNLNFNWRLLMAPLEILDYIVIHELAHLLEMNHSKRFWEIVERQCPNYKLYDKWLHVNGHLLTF